MRALDLFAGAGGWDLAARDLGIEADGVEIMPEAVATREAAGLSTPFRDVRDLDYGALSYDGLIASPPCQSFSVAGMGAGRKTLDVVLAAVDRFVDHPLLWPEYEELSRLTGDERTALVLEPLRAALSMRPEWIAWEQVPAVLPVWEASAEVLRRLGYDVSVGNLHAEAYGVPQTRTRAVLVASRVRPVALPTPTHSRFHSLSPETLDEGVAKWRSMSDALGWHPGERVGFPRRADRPGDKAGKHVVRIGGVDYRARDLRRADRPAFNLTEKARSWRRFSVAEDPRRVTIAEAGALQGFPPGFPWRGSKTKQFLQVGNAIPPGLARAVLSTLTREETQ